MPVGIGEQAFNVLLRFVVDKKTLADIETGTTSLQEALTQMDGAGQQLAVSAYRLQPALDAQIKKTAELQNAWWKTQRVLRATSFVFQELSIAGLGMITPLILAANKFATEAKKTDGVLDPVAEHWLQLQDSIKKSTMSVGRTTAEVLMPALEVVAKLAEKGAKIVEQHPEIIEAALKIGTAVATVGVLGKLVTDGVKFFVDAKFVLASAQNLLAGELMIKAAKDNLLAAIAMEAAGGPGSAGAAQDIIMGTSALSKSGTATMAGLGAAATASLVTVIALGVGAEIGKWLGNLGGRAINGPGYKDRNLGDAANTAFQIASLPGQLYLKKLNEVGIVSDKVASSVGNMVGKFSQWIGTTFGTAEAAEKSAEAMDKLTVSLKGNENEAKIVEAYAKMVKENADAAAKYAQDKLKIEEDTNGKLLKAATSLANDLTKIHNNLARDIAKINSDAASDQAKDDAKYAKQRAETIRESNKEIIRMRQDHQRDLQKLERDHNRTISKLVGERDALGIVEENRRYQDQLAESNQAFNVEMQRRREDIKQKLADQAAEYAAEKAQRIADTAQKIADAQAKAKQEAADRRAQYIAERREILADRAQKLRDLQDQYNQERMRRREAFIALVRDLDASLLGERNLKNKYYASMLKDAEAFLAAYRAKLPTSANSIGGVRTSAGSYVPKATGNYVSGNIHTGEYGEEFLLTNKTTKLAEQAVGSRLTQDSLLSRLAGGGNQTIQIITGNGVTVAQVKRMLKQSNNIQYRDLAHALGA